MEEEQALFQMMVNIFFLFFSYLGNFSHILPPEQAVIHPIKLVETRQILKEENELFLSLLKKIAPQKGIFAPLNSEKISPPLSAQVRKRMLT